MDLIESALNSVPSDDGEDDEIIYILSISSVVKEINSSAPRVADAFVRNAGQACPVNGVCDWLAENASEFILDNGDVVGGYNIPEEQDRIDQIIGELPPNAQDKLVRDVGEKKNGTFVDTEAGYWNRAVIIVGVAENDKNGDGIPDVSTSELIKRTQKRIEDISIANNWGGIDKNGNFVLMMIQPSKKNSV